MANAPMFSDAAVIAGVDAVTALLNSGSLKIYTGSAPGDANQTVTGTLLATLPLSSTAFITPAVASGSTGSRLVTATANAITNASAVATGTAGYFTLENSSSTVVSYGTVGTSGSDLNFNSTAISSGATISCSAFTIVMPEQ